MFNKYILILLFSISLSIKAQQVVNFCGTDIPSLQWETVFSGLVNDFKKEHSYQNNYPFADYTIPVIFHIIHSGQSVGIFPNIVQAR